MKEALIEDKEKNNESSVNLSKWIWKQQGLWFCQRLRQGESNWIIRRYKKKWKSPEEYELTYQFQGQYAILQHGFNLDPDGI